MKRFIIFSCILLVVIILLWKIPIFHTGDIIIIDPHITASTKDGLNSVLVFPKSDKSSADENQEIITSFSEKSDLIFLWLRKNAQTLKLEISSGGTQGFSYNLDTTHLITTEVNDTLLQRQNDSSPYIYLITQNDNPIQNIKIRIDFKNPYWFTELQELNKILLVHWLSDEEFEQLKQEKLRELEN